MVPPRGARVWLVSMAAAATMAAAETPLPPLAGEVSGEFAPLLLAGAPTVKWTLALRAGTAAGERIADLGIEGAGVKGTGALRLMAATRGMWRLDAGEVELRTWLPLLAQKFLPLLTGALADGHVAIRGEGTLDDGRVGGRVAVELRNGSLRHAARGWALSGVMLKGGLGQLPELTSEGAWTLTFEEGNFAGLAARNGVVEFAIDAQEVVHVRRATCEMLEGRVEVAAFSFSLAKPVVKTDVRVNQIELAQLATLLPPVLSAASGKISGRVGLAWDAETGVHPGSGRLQIDPGSTVTFRLAPQPGFLTSKLPATISPLPGPLAKLMTIPNPAYAPLRAIEMGETRLEVSALDIGLSPDGDAEGRSARLVFTARPEKGDEVEFVKFEVNVKGPLADVLRLGFEHGVSIRAR